MARDPQQMASYLRRGRSRLGHGKRRARQWRWASSGGARPLLLTERNGVRQYQTVFFVRRDSPIQQLQGCAGIAWRCRTQRRPAPTWCR